MPTGELPSEHSERMAVPGASGWDDIPAWRARSDAAMGNLPSAEHTIATAISANGVDAFLQQREDSAADPLVVYFHGGGYVVASALAYRSYCSHLVERAGVRVLNVDYRRAPEDPFPAAIEDAQSAYEWALERESAATVVLAGDSAGAGLLVAALMVMRDWGLPLPAGGICLSPWVDLTNSAATYTTRAATDTMFSLESARKAAELYLCGHDATDPLASPVYADLSGLPAAPDPCRRR
jgi:acetyl esterase/lipase